MRTIDGTSHLNCKLPCGDEAKISLEGPKLKPWLLVFEFTGFKGHAIADVKSTALCHPWERTSTTGPIPCRALNTVVLPEVQLVLFIWLPRIRWISVSSQHCSSHFITVLIFCRKYAILVVFITPRQRPIFFYHDQPIILRGIGYKVKDIKCS